VKFFSPKEIRELVQKGDIDDALSLSALAIVGINF